MKYVLIDKIIFIYKKIIYFKKARYVMKTLIRDVNNLINLTINLNYLKG
jgi:hypothetical protein